MEEGVCRWHNLSGFFVAGVLEHLRIYIVDCLLREIVGVIPRPLEFAEQRRHLKTQTHALRVRRSAPTSTFLS